MDYASLGSLAVAFVALIISIFNTSKRDTKEVSTQIAMMMTKLDNIYIDLRELKTVREEMREDIRKNYTDIIKLKETMKSALAKINDWKQITEQYGLRVNRGHNHETDHK